MCNSWVCAESPRLPPSKGPRHGAGGSWRERGPARRSSSSGGGGQRALRGLCCRGLYPEALGVLWGLLDLHPTPSRQSLSSHLLPSAVLPPRAPSRGRARLSAISCFVNLPPPPQLPPGPGSCLLILQPPPQTPLKTMAPQATSATQTNQNAKPTSEALSCSPSTSQCLLWALTHTFPLQRPIFILGNLYEV